MVTLVSWPTTAWTVPSAAMTSVLSQVPQVRVTLSSLVGKVRSSVTVSRLALSPLTTSYRSAMTMSALSSPVGREASISDLLRA